MSEIVCSCALVRGFLLLHYFTFESKVVQKLKCQAAQFHHPASLYSSEHMFEFFEKKKSICNEEVQKYLSVSSFLACTLNRLLIHLRRCCCLWQMTHFWPREILSNFPRSCKGFQLHLDTLHYVLWCIVSSQELWRILKVKLADLSIIFSSLSWLLTHVVQQYEWWPLLFSDFLVKWIMAVSFVPSFIALGFPWKSLANHCHDIFITT